MPNELQWTASSIANCSKDAPSAETCKLHGLNTIFVLDSCGTGDLLFHNRNVNSSEAFLHLQLIAWTQSAS